MVITQARLARIAEGRGDPRLNRPLKAAERLTGELRNCILDIRMVPIGTIFGKFRRCVRDMSHDLGKEIDLVVTIEAYDSLELIFIAAQFEAGKAYGVYEDETSNFLSFELNYEF